MEVQAQMVPMVGVPVRSALQSAAVQEPVEMAAIRVRLNRMQALLAGKAEGEMAQPAVAVPVPVASAAAEVQAVWGGMAVLARALPSQEPA